MPDFVVAIPARYAASRLPGKPLRLLGGKPLVWHVAQRALTAGAREVWVAADDPRIIEAVQGEGVRVAMTSPEHASGTDRLAECADIAGWREDDIVVNLQGDEPFAPAGGIRAVAGLLARSGCEMATLAARADAAPGRQPHPDEADEVWFQKAVEICRRSIRECDTVLSVGPYTFLAILPLTAKPGLSVIETRLHDNLRPLLRWAKNTHGQDWQLVTAGACAPEEAEDWRTFVDLARIRLRVGVENRTDGPQAEAA